MRGRCRQFSKPAFKGLKSEPVHLNRRRREAGGEDGGRGLERDFHKNLLQPLTAFVLSALRFAAFERFTKIPG